MILHEVNDTYMIDPVLIYDTNQIDYSQDKIHRLVIFFLTYGKTIYILLSKFSIWL